jgi:hypothetical protein
MYRYLIVLLFLSIGVSSHEFTPTYPTLKPSHIAGLLKVQMQLLNKREDISYYEIEVFDRLNNPIKFAAEERIVQVPYLKRKSLNIYIREKDRYRVYYICTKSKILAGQKKASAVSSKICSKIKE